MRMNVYTIYDVAAGVYLRPFFHHSDGAATRVFKDMVMDGEHDIGRHPEDYSLYRIGTYDDNKGSLAAEEKDCLATALEMLSESRQVNKQNLIDFDEAITAENKQTNEERANGR